MKVELRKLKLSDASILQKLRDDKEVNKYLEGSPYPYKLSDAKWSIKKGLKKDNYKFAILVNKEFVGTIALENPNESKTSFETGLFLGRKYWNKGIGTEALKEIVRFGFKELKLKRIWAGVLSNNVGSSKAVEKAGFKLEGRLKCATYKNRRYFDELIYGRVR